MTMYDQQLPTSSTDADLLQLYIAGESYAGQYIPYIAQAMVKTMSSQDAKRVRGLKHS